ncbi:MAG TPA: DUF434 domain-containing protein, partial [Candidatus Methanofastidiosa archaeon]|nr:DUF434 domain-containing protein [Candidatus Methanofastidiosa archaeon]
DLRDLLNKDYRKKAALEFVCNHYGLERGDRNILARTTFSDDVSARTRKKEVPDSSLQGEDILIDTYNVLITVESVLFDDPLVCDDGVVRDGRGVFGNYAIGDNTLEALGKIKEFIRKRNVAKATFYIDKNVSKSGELASTIRDFRWGIDVDVVVSDVVDSTLRKSKGIVATADYGIIKYIERFVDIPKSLLFSW